VQLVLWCRIDCHELPQPTAADSSSDLCSVSCQPAVLPLVWCCWRGQECHALQQQWAAVRQQQSHPVGRSWMYPFPSSSESFHVLTTCGRPCAVLQAQLAGLTGLLASPARVAISWCRHWSARAWRQVSSGLYIWSAGKGKAGNDSCIRREGGSRAVLVQTPGSRRRADRSVQHCHTTRWRCLG
jgi:hypothetical protein